MGSRKNDRPRKDTEGTQTDELDEIMPQSDVPMSDHMAKEIEAVHRLGRSLEPGEAVPECRCAQCVGLPLGWHEREIVSPGDDEAA